MSTRLSLDRNFLKMLEEVTLLSRDDLSGTIGSDHRSRVHGPGLDFSDYRRYSSGDDPRSLDWNAYLRLGKLFLKTYRIEERISIRILLDCSESMNTGHGRESKFTYARHLAAAFAYLALFHLDTVAIAPFGTQMAKPLVVSGGRDSFWTVVDFLNSLNCSGETNLFSTAKQFLAAFPQKGTVLAISDFFDEEGCERAVDMLRTTGHDLVLLQVHTAEELRPTTFGELMLEDAETGAKRTVVSSPETTAAYEQNFLAFSERVQRLAIRNGGRFSRVSTTVPFEEFVLRGLRRSQVMA
jgi:uncharacterized protein (DUF58 family)